MNNLIIEDIKYFNKKKIKIIKDFDRDVTIVSDLFRLKNILKNLLSNAQTFSNPILDESFVKISLKKDKNYHVIIIEDNGIGIIDNAQEKVFNMFYKGMESKDGSGLGLYIAKKMISKLDGMITVKSEYGKKSIFKVSLPV